MNQPTEEHIKRLEEEWNRLLATPESDAFLDYLSEEALREYREGRTEEGGFGNESTNTRGIRSVQS